MQKLKTCRSAAKRFRTTASGKIKRSKAYVSHILTKKTTKRKRHLRKSTYVSKVDSPRMKKLIPYK
ncbi:MAG: 50S ribosomal protein L35 [Candidatus Schekmanbacteria bacterium RBG_13_48_7]|uniref:Large ribosomal subunit protein bL35 n=1 Tax=Candidatus Schekmanbacteria bacterium RBG_13_48_7 TaxID=1817878 RepID=A0A1F7RNT6_9BACT|nr:MAG: 50S ribosomal protein L35 [Candidatus Schekmanbacteria bacterium RBG_13_48_7]